MRHGLPRRQELTFDSKRLHFCRPLFSPICLFQSNMSKLSSRLSRGADGRGSLLLPPYRDETTEIAGKPQATFFCSDAISGTSLERRYSSRTFRYGYLVTT